MKKTTEQFIKEAELAHGDKYDYTKVNYINARAKVCIICPVHGEFWQTPDHHLSKKTGCPECAKLNRAKKQTKSKEQFIKDANLVHNSFYDYSLVDYKNSGTKIKIICPKHGMFEQTPNAHLNKRGCPKCANNETKTTEQFIVEVKNIKLDKVYDFSKTKYINARTNIAVVCKKCNKDFFINPRSLLKGTVKACPNCNYYIGEKIIEETLKENNVKYISQYKFKNSEISKLSFDFYLPEKNITIEYQGLQHFKAVKKWGGEERLKRQQINDQRKREFCKKNNIKEIEITKENLKDILTIFKNYNIIF